MTAAGMIAQALAGRAEDVATSLLGKPSSASKRELRFGRRGSLALRLDGTRRGQWYDHERGSGGELLRLIARERGVSLGDAMRIARQDFLGSDISASTAPRAIPAGGSSPALDDSASRVQAALRIFAE